MCFVFEHKWVFHTDMSPFLIVLARECELGTARGGPLSLLISVSVMLMYNYPSKFAGQIHLCDKKGGRGDEGWTGWNSNFNLYASINTQWQVQLLSEPNSKTRLLWKCWVTQGAQESCMRSGGFGLIIRAFWPKCPRTARDMTRLIILGSSLL